MLETPPGTRLENQKGFPYKIIHQNSPSLLRFCVQFTLPCLPCLLFSVIIKEKRRVAHTVCFCLRLLLLCIPTPDETCYHWPRTQTVRCCVHTQIHSSSRATDQYVVPVLLELRDVASLCSQLPPPIQPVCCNSCIRMHA
jgi:hypothetical protein